MILLVCGGRDYDGPLDALADIAMPDIVIHGNQRGADKRAGNWFQKRGIHTAAVDALWDYYDRPAGHKRNAVMLKLKPTHCIAFPGGSGTAGMVKLCQKAGMFVWQPYTWHEDLSCYVINPPPEEFLLLAQD